MPEYSQYYPYNIEKFIDEGIEGAWVVGGSGFNGWDIKIKTKLRTEQIHVNIYDGAGEYCQWITDTYAKQEDSNVVNEQTIYLANLKAHRKVLEIELERSQKFSLNRDLQVRCMIIVDMLKKIDEEMENNDA